MLNTGRSDLRFFARKSLQTRLGVRPTGSCKMRRILFSSPQGKCLNIVEKTEGMSMVDASFAPRACPRSVKNKNGHVTLLPSSIGHGGHYDTKYSLFDSILRAVFVVERTCFLVLEPACKT